MVNLPSFKRSRRSNNAETTAPAHVSTEDQSSDKTLHNSELDLTTAQIKRATKTRKIFALLSSFFLFCAVIFMILVEIGNTYIHPALTNLYFIKLNLSDIFPVSVPDATLLNTIAETLGLHDFYQVGLWNFCEGYEATGISDCSKPVTLYWFDPVEILLSELLSGATIALPAELTNILSLIRIVSHLMFGFFLAGTCLAFVMIFLSPIIVRSRWWALVIGIFTFIAALLITAGTIIATVLFIIFKNVITAQTELNIGAKLGVPMFAMMWTATACSIFALVIQICLMCCCASRRDVRRGKKRGNEKAYAADDAALTNEKPKRGLFGRRKA